MKLQQNKSFVLQLSNSRNLERPVFGQAQKGSGILTPK
jgi:hypothetical protein